LDDYARIHECKTNIPASQTKFIIVTHSMGGLVARTFLSEYPEWASPRLCLVGSPNAGSVEAIRTVVVGPDSLKMYATGFPGVFLNLVQTNVDQNVTKLVGITRPSLYELLPFDDPHWQSRQAGGTSRRMNAQDILDASSWETYWPSAQLERKLFLADDRSAISHILHQGAFRSTHRVKIFCESTMSSNRQIAGRNFTRYGAH
jgi:pimeloyl-ACP methyl ester carboxylesterase